MLFFVGVHALNHGHLFDYDRKKADRVSTEIAKNVKIAAETSGGLTAAQTERVGELIGEAVAREPGRMDAATVREIVERVRREAAGRAAPPGAAPPAAESAAKPPPPKPDRTPKLRINEDDRFGLGTALKKKIEAGELTLSGVFDAFESRVPTLLFLGMPVFGLILKLLYWRSGRFYIEHLIFSVHLHTWAFLAFMLGNGYFKLVALGPGWLTTTFAWLLAGWMLWYVPTAFRVVYEQRWLRTVFKVFATGVLYMTALCALTFAVVISTILWLVYH